MSRDYNKKIFNDINIINENIKNDYIYKNENINKINTEFDKFIKYNKIDNFSDLFRKRVANTVDNVPPSIGGLGNNTKPVVNVPPKPDSIGNDNKPVSPVPDLQGRTYDASRMWSPVSMSGVVYEWNRGVIGISDSGEVLKEKLDGTINHHSDATVRIARGLGVIISDTTAPFEAAVNATKDNLIIFQSEGDNAFVYFPKEISSSQYEQLENILLPRDSFNFSFTYGEDIYEELSCDAVLDFAKKIIRTDLKYNQIN